MAEKAKPGERAISVVTRASGTVFHRAGLEFCWNAVVVREAEIGTERFERILNEPHLTCTVLEG